MGLLERIAPTLYCARCHEPFPKESTARIMTLATLVTCANCGYEVTGGDLMSGEGPREVDLNPRGPFSQPSESQVTCTRPHDDVLVIEVPADDGFDGVVSMAVIWNAISWLAFLAFLAKAPTEPVWLLLFPFLLVGIFFAVKAVRRNRSRDLLTLDRNGISFSRSFCLKTSTKRIIDLQVVHRIGVLVMQRRHGPEPVYGVELKGKRSRIRLGSTLSEDDQIWLCSEVKDFVKRHLPCPLSDFLNRSGSGGR